MVRYPLGPRATGRRRRSLLGAVWYSPPLFARQWQAAIGWDESRPQPQTNPVTYVVPAILYLIAAIATGLLAAATGTDTLTEGITLGLVTGSATRCRWSAWRRRSTRTSRSR